MIFSKNKKTGATDYLNLTIEGELIPKAETNNIKFLGIRFEFLFSFKNQMDHLIKTVRDRANLLKVLSHKSWRLSTNTKINIYKIPAMI